MTNTLSPAAGAPAAGPAPARPAASNAVGERLHTDPAYQAFWLLRVGFSVAPILFGLDKYFHVLVDWDRYLAPIVVRQTPWDAHQLMYAVGAIEILAGVIVAVRPRFGGYLVAAWLAGIIVNLLVIPGFYDIALRDFGLFIGALALARLATAFPTPARRRRPGADMTAAIQDELHLHAVRDEERIDLVAAERAVRDLLLALGRDPGVEHLQDTPRRVAGALAELLTPEPFRLTTFANDEGYDELVVARTSRSVRCASTTCCRSRESRTSGTSPTHASWGCRSSRASSRCSRATSRCRKG